MAPRTLLIPSLLDDWFPLLQYAFRSDRWTPVLLTDDTDTTVTELQLYIQDCPYTTRELIEEDLNKELNFPVYVFSE